MTLSATQHKVKVTTAARSADSRISIGHCLSSVSDSKPISSTHRPTKPVPVSQCEQQQILIDGHLQQEMRHLVEEYKQKKQADEADKRESEFQLEQLEKGEKMRKVELDSARISERVWIGARCVTVR